MSNHVLFQENISKLDRYLFKEKIIKKVVFRNVIVQLQIELLQA